MQKRIWFSIQCISHESIFSHWFQTQVDSSKFVVYMCEQVLPRFNEINSTEEGLQLDVLKLFAELCSHCNSLPNSEVHVQQVMDKLIVSVYK